MKKFFNYAIMALVLGLPLGCSKLSDYGDEAEGSIQFGVVDKNLVTVSTKTTTPATSVTSFKCAATTGSAGSETAATWNNVTFTSDGAGTPTYSGGKYWPGSNPSYNFYAVTASESSAAALYSEAPNMTFAAAGSSITMAAGYDKDVACAYLVSGTGSGKAEYKTKNTLSFEHIYARVAGVTVNAADVCDISNISIWIKDVKTGGTYNIRTGKGQNNGTGWSSKVPADGTNTKIYEKAGTITHGGNDNTGSVYNNTTNSFYLVPGTYKLIATWTAAVGEYSQTYETMTTTATISIQGGKINTISCNLTGDPAEVEFSVSLAAWGTNAISGVTFPHS